LQPKGVIDGLILENYKNPCYIRLAPQEQYSMIIETVITLIAATPTPVPTGISSGGPPLSLTLMLICTGGALSLVFGLLVLGFIAANQNRKNSEDKTKASGESKGK
jgi:hypothetical protein